MHPGVGWGRCGSMLPRGGASCAAVPGVPPRARAWSRRTCGCANLRPAWVGNSGRRAVTKCVSSSALGLTCCEQVSHIDCAAVVQQRPRGVRGRLSDPSFIFGFPWLEPDLVPSCGGTALGVQCSPLGAPSSSGSRLAGARLRNEPSKLWSVVPVVPQRHLCSDKQLVRDLLAWFPASGRYFLLGL